MDNIIEVHLFAFSDDGKFHRVKNLKPKFENEQEAIEYAQENAEAFDRFGGKVILLPVIPLVKEHPPKG